MVKVASRQLLIVEVRLAGTAQRAIKVSGTPRGSILAAYYILESPYVMPVAKTRHQRSIGFFILVGISIIAYAGLVRLDWQFGTLRAQAVPQTIGWYLCWRFRLCWQLLLAERHSLSMKWVWGSRRLLFRLLLLLTTPTLSDDIYRYLWDGHVANR